MMTKTMKKLLLILAIFFGLTTFAQTKELFLFSEETFLGCIGCSDRDENSICNERGKYGNKRNSDSIWNRYGTYGSKYDSKSPWNQYSDDAPIITDKNHSVYGRFTINKYARDANDDFTEHLKRIYDLVSGDLENFRNLYCDGL